MKFAFYPLFITGFILTFFSSLFAEIKTQRVFNNVFVLIAENKKSYNTTFIITSKGVIIIDPGGTPKHGKKVFEEIRKRTDLPIKAVINTSYLGKASFANQVFQDADLIIAHKDTQKALGGNKDAFFWDT